MCDSAVPPAAPIQVSEARFSRNSSRQLLICRPGAYYHLSVTTNSANTFAIEMGSLIVWKYSVPCAGSYEIPIHVENDTSSVLHYRADLIVASPDYCGSHFDAYLITSRVCPEITLHYLAPEYAVEMTYEQYRVYFNSLPRLKFSSPNPETVTQSPTELSKVFTEAGIYTKFTVDSVAGCSVDLHLSGFHVGKYEVEAGLKTVLLDPPIVYDEELAAKARLKDYEFRVVATGEIKSLQVSKIPLSVTRPEMYGNYVSSLVKSS